MKFIAHIGFVVALLVILIVNIVLYNKNDVIDVKHPDLDSFSIAELSNEQIISIDNHYESYKTHTERLGKKSGISGIYELYDCDISKFSSQKATGIISLSATLAKDCKIEITINSYVEQGDAKLVIICNDEIVEILDANSNSSYVYNVIGEHTYYVKALCNRANVKFEISRTITCNTIKNRSK